MITNNKNDDFKQMKVKRWNILSIWL